MYPELEEYSGPTPAELDEFLALQDWFELMYELRAIENNPAIYKCIGVYYHESNPDTFVPSN